MKLFGFSVLVLFLAGCASTNTGRVYLPRAAQDKSGSSASASPPAHSSVSGSLTPQTDYFALQKELGLDRSAQVLGFKEKSFNPCERADGSDAEDCRSQYFVVIHFQLLCRDSEGTLSRALSAEDMRPISYRSVRWTLKADRGPAQAGDVQTDADGFGQIRTVASVSGRQQRLKLAVGPEFLYMRAGEITRVVTPQPWCNP